MVAEILPKLLISNLKEMVRIAIWIDSPRLASKFAMCSLNPVLMITLPSNTEKLSDYFLGQTRGQLWLLRIKFFYINVVSNPE